MRARARRILSNSRKEISERLKKVNPMKFFPKIFVWFWEMSYLCNVVQQER